MTLILHLKEMLGIKLKMEIGNVSKRMKPDQRVENNQRHD